MSVCLYKVSKLSNRPPVCVIGEYKIIITLVSVLLNVINSVM